MFVLKIIFGLVSVVFVGLVINHSKKWARIVTGVGVLGGVTYGAYEEFSGSTPRISIGGSSGINNNLYWTQPPSSGSNSNNKSTISRGNNSSGNSSGGLSQQQLQNIQSQLNAIQNTINQIRQLISSKK